MSVQDTFVEGKTGIGKKSQEQKVTGKEVTDSCLQGEGKCSVVDLACQYVNCDLRTFFFKGEGSS